MTISNINVVGSPNYRNQRRETRKNTKQKDYGYSPRDLYGLPKGITIASSQSYYPNLTKLSNEELFDIQFHSGTKLSNGSVLIRPVILSLGTVDIRPVKDLEKVYIINIRQNDEKSHEITRFMNEENLLKNRSLTRGAIKEVEPGKYNMIFIDKNGKKQNITTDKKECLAILRDNLLYM